MFLSFQQPPSKSATTLTGSGAHTHTRAHVHTQPGVGGRRTCVPLTFHWKLGCGAPSASHVTTLETPSSARRLDRLVITGFPAERQPSVSVPASVGRLQGGPRTPGSREGTVADLLPPAGSCCGAPEPSWRPHTRRPQSQQRSAGPARAPSRSSRPEDRRHSITSGSPPGMEPPQLLHHLCLTPKPASNCSNGTQVLKEQHQVLECPPASSPWSR